MGVLLFSPDDKVTSQMLQMGYDPSKGLGKQQTGIIEPICPTPQQLCTGLCFPNLYGGHCFCCQPFQSWKSQDRVWVEQWPLPKEKLLAAKALFFEQLELGDIEPSNSPWNTPIFVIQKKSGKWPLSQDLRDINATMEDMGALQPGLPSPVAIPEGYCD